MTLDKMSENELFTIKLIFEKMLAGIDAKLIKMEMSGEKIVKEMDEEKA